MNPSLLPLPRAQKKPWSLSFVNSTVNSTPSMRYFSQDQGGQEDRARTSGLSQGSRTYPGGRKGERNTDLLWKRGRFKLKMSKETWTSNLSSSPFLTRAGAGRGSWTSWVQLQEIKLHFSMSKWHDMNMSWNINPLPMKRKWLKQRKVKEFNSLSSKDCELICNAKKRKR